MNQEPGASLDARSMNGGRQLRIQANLEEAARVERALAQAGFPIALNDMINKTVDYRGAVPILLDWLPRVHQTDVKATIASALATPWATPVAAPTLIREFECADDPTGLGLKWAIGNALSVVADDSVFEDIVRIAEDKMHGRGREMVVVALGNMKNPSAIDVLIGLLHDEEVAGHALMALRKVGARARKARPYVEPFLNHPKAWVRKEAQRALKRMD